MLCVCSSRHVMIITTDDGVKHCGNCYFRAGQQGRRITFCGDCTNRGFCPLGHGDLLLGFEKGAVLVINKVLIKTGKTLVRKSADSVNGNLNGEFTHCPL